MPRPDYPTAEPFLPADATDLDALAAAEQGCRGCPLWEGATQAVPGEGPRDARLVLVGEQPGDVEDREGRPFVGPSGALLRAMLEEAGIAADAAFVTNAVKHFKFTPRGKRRIHASPDTWETAACRPWLVAELNALRPRVVVLLGATAAKAVYGSTFRVTQERGRLLDWPDGLGGAEHGLATLHPSAVLRAEDRTAARAGVVADLQVVADILAA